MINVVRQFNDMAFEDQTKNFERTHILYIYIY